jgi:hypothetical protein
MIELIDTNPDVQVQQSEYQRLLGYPREWNISGRALELAKGARNWYREHGRPWAYARPIACVTTSGDRVCLDGFQFCSQRLQATLDRARADQLVVAAVSAGAELEQHAQQLWREEKPDEYFFWEVFGSAVVEHLITILGARLCAMADGEGLAVLPHYSPGYFDWDIAEQPRLLELAGQTGQHALPGPLSALESGMLRPKKSLLAVFGVTRHTANILRLADLNPCQNCSYLPCQYRRAAYRRALPSAPDAVVPALEPAELGLRISPLNRKGKYFVNRKALSRWAAERLTLVPSNDGGIEARFHYEGTTCSNVGRRLSFDYCAWLGPREEGFPIRDVCCAPAPDDEGHLLMCRFFDDDRELKAILGREKPLLGRPIDDVLSWADASTGACCYCEPADRLHKWRLVLETIHYALVQREEQSTAPADAAKEKT